MRKYNIMVIVDNLAAGKDFNTWNIDVMNSNEVNEESERLFNELKPLINEALTFGRKCTVLVHYETKELSFDFLRTSCNDVVIRAFSALTIVTFL